MPLDFSSGGTPVNTGVLDFSGQGTPIGGKPKRTPQQVMQEVAAAQASRDVVSPPETQGLIGQIAAGLETPVRVLNSPTLDIGSAFSLAKQAEIMGGRNYSIPTAESYPAWRATQLRELSRSSGGADYGPGNTAFPQIDQRLQEYFKNNILGRKISQPGLTLQDIVSVLNRENVAPVLQPVQEPSLPSQVVGGVVGAGEDLVGGLLSFLTSPAGAVTAGAGSVGPVVQNALKAAFGASLLGSAVQGGQETIARSEQGDVGGTVRSGLGTAIGGGLGAHLLKKGVKDAWNSRVLTAEIVPPLQRPVAPVGRQLQAPEQSFIDAEVVVPPRLPAPGERPTMPVGSPLDRPAGAARFGVDPTGKAVDISQLSPKEQIELYRGPKEFVPREQYVRPSQGPVPIVGEPKMMPNPLPNVDQPLVPFQNVTRPLKREFVPSKLPVEPSGGEVSFRAPAQAQGIPSARQSALPQAEMPKREVVFQNETAPEAPAKPVKGGIGGGIKGAVEKNKEAGSVENPFKKGRLNINPIGPIVKQIAKDVATLGKKVKEVGTDFIRAYAEPLQEQMGRLGGPVGKMVSEEAGQIISRGKELYGELTPVIDPAKKQVGKMMRGGTTWMRGRNEVTPYASFNNFFGVNEGVGVIPTEARRGMKLAADANLAIGKLAERANPGFKASGKLQRIPTTVGYDFIVNGGEGRNRWIEGVAKLNNKPISEVENFFNKMKETLGDPSSDAASLDRINQDFTRKFPRTITHIKTATGWHEVVMSDPFNYLEQAAQRTAHSVAFREVYPLIQHQGQWVQSGKLQATRKAIMKELDKGSDIVKFDNLVKALQGHPLDTFKGGATTAIGAVSGTIGSPLKALMLSANAPVNIGEVLSGGPSIFMGYTTMGKAVAKMLTDNTFYDQLELTGARNKAMYNMALDPSSPMRSVARQVASGIRTITGQQFLNEIQETTAAASAKVYSDAVKNGQMGEYSLNRAKALFRAMGFNEGQASKMIKGDVELLKQFENRAAAWLTTGNQSTAEMSRLGASRLFNAVFWFHKYPQMTLNQFRSVGGNWIDDVHAFAKKPTKDNWSPLYHNSVLMGRLLGGRSLQGAITLGILAGISGGIYGIYQTMREAEEDSLKFAGDSLVSGFGGSLSVMQRLNQNVKGGESFTKELVKLSAPASINQDLIDMGMGVGRYAGMSKMESISTFLESKTPISRTIRMGLAVGGLAEKDLELEVAMKAFYKWRKEQPGFVPMGQMGGTEDQIEIRSGMQKVKKAIESGEDWVAELKKVKDTKGAGASLRAGTMLQLNGKPLDAEQMKSLEKRLGTNGLEKIKLRDAMVREVGRELNEKKGSGEKQAPEEIKKPTGKWAVDYETDSVRSQRVMGRLDVKVQEFLKQNGVEDVGYTPSLKRGPKRQQLTVEQAKVLEDELVVQLDKMVGTLAKNKNLESQTPKLRQTLISNMLEGARKIAMAKSLGKIPQDPEQQRK